MKFHSLPLLTTGSHKEESMGEDYTLAYSHSNVKDCFCWGFEGVCEPNCDRKRRFLWKELTSLSSWQEVP